jgi:zinc protease
VQDGERQVTLRRVGNTQWLSDLYHTVPAAHPDSVALEAAVGVMTVSPGGRLYKALVETKKAASVDDFVYNGHDPSFAIFLVKVPDQDPIEGAREVMLKTIEDARRCQSRRQLDRVRAGYQTIDDTINDPQPAGLARRSRRQELAAVFLP